ncbi:MAG: hypothetical protein HEQ12_12240 [Aphanizomenon flos-aquae DEX188]|jgi:hypothetical protein|nr:MAG: hypothetical protein HEQ12_12240 [Aphanizomenon flos-aquae DEX188]
MDLNEILIGNAMRVITHYLGKDDDKVKNLKGTFACTKCKGSNIRRAEKGKDNKVYQCADCGNRFNIDECLK